MILVLLGADVLIDWIGQHSIPLVLFHVVRILCWMVAIISPLYPLYAIGLVERFYEDAISKGTFPRPFTNERRLLDPSGTAAEDRRQKSDLDETTGK